MKRKITLLSAGFMLCLGIVRAQVPCADDPNGFVASKNVGSTSSYQLKIGFEEKAAQTYDFNGTGKIMSVRVYGTHQTMTFSGVPLKVSVYNVDANGKPTTLISSMQHVWWSYPDNNNGYIQLNFPGGVSVSTDFALTVEVLNAPPFGSNFNLKYTGNGEGLGQDLASLSGTSTGNNWASAMTSFGSNGDFYIIPTMSLLNLPSFDINTACLQTNELMTITNTSQLATDSMFNQISESTYSGINHIYSWDFGDGSPISHALAPSHAYATAGAYTITLTTKIEGWNQTCTKTFTKQVSVGLGVSASALTNVTCNGLANGSVVALPQGGMAPYQFSLNNGPWQATAAFTNLAPGSYQLQVKDQKNCTSTVTFNIIQPAGISINSILATNSACGQPNGAFTAAATGGMGTLQYKINNGTYQNSGTFSALSAGIYVLSVKDANACVSTANVSINSSTAPSLNPPNVNNVSCFNGNDGSISLSSTGGTGLVQYSTNNGQTFQNNGLFTGLSAGAYTCVVKDNAGCTSFAVANVTQGTAMSVVASPTAVSCFGANNGSISVASYGGTGTHTYSLNGVNYQSLNQFTGLYAGTYNVYVKDVTSCVKTAIVTVNQAPALAASMGVLAATCNGQATGSITATISGGTPSYSYSLDGIIFQSSNIFSNLIADTFSLTVKDANNCLLTTSVLVGQPSALSATVNTTNATCMSSNGSIMVVAAGGAGNGYMYSLDGINFSATGLFSNLAAGTHFVVLRDANMCQNTVSGVITSAGGPQIGSLSAQNVSCNGGTDGAITVLNVTGGTGSLQYSKNGINFQPTNVFNNLGAGAYIIHVKDANGCIDTMAKTVLQPNAFLVMTNVTDVLCHGASTGAAQVLASGGAGFFAYSLNNGLNYQAGSNFLNLGAGSYTVLIKDAANCIAVHNFIITEPSPIQVHTATLNVTCYGANDGEITITASGGVAPYLYSVNALPFSGLTNYDNLAGDQVYEVHVKDSNLCMVTVYRFVNEPSLIQLDYLVTNVSCFGGNNGAVNLNLTGGVSPYTISWSDQSIGSSISNLSAGPVGVEVSDLNGCTGQMDFIIAQPAAPLVVNANITHASSASALDGALDLTTTGGTPPYSYIWSNAATDEDLTDLGVGLYIVTITDDNGCSLATTFQINNMVGVETQVAPEWSIYPNPATDLLFSDFGLAKPHTLRIYNALGQVFLLETSQEKLGKIDVSFLPAGTYMIELSYDLQQETRLFTIIK